MTEASIKKWFCHKLQCYGEFIREYTAALSDRDNYYIELFATGNNYHCADINDSIAGSEQRALDIKKAFSRYIFICRDIDDSTKVSKLAFKNNKFSIITGNPINNEVLKQAFDLIPRSSSSFVYIDPPGYHRLRWSTIKKLALHSADWQGHKADLLIMLPLEMALLRNLTRDDCRSSINRLYGNNRWVEIKDQWQKGILEPDEVRQQLASLFTSGLKKLDYRYVGDVIPAPFSKPPFYYIICASDRTDFNQLVKNIWTKSRYLPCEMFHGKGSE
jgi:three-Cys-motif partner protein